MDWDWGLDLEIEIGDWILEDGIGNGDIADLEIGLSIGH